MSDTKSMDRIIRILDDELTLLMDSGIAAKMMDSAIIVGTAADGSIKMMTTIEDVAEIIWHLEAAKHSLMSGDFED